MQNPHNSFTKMHNQKQYLPALPEHRDSAMQIFRTSNDISTPEKLALVLSDESIARYKDIPEGPRKLWIGSQIYALCMILHYQPPAALDVEIDSAFADQMIMENEGIRCLKQVEMQEAFRRGISREYGDFYGITASSLIAFLEGYLRSEKRAKAVSMLYKKEREQEQKKDEMFWKAIHEARQRGFNIPDIEREPDESAERHRQRTVTQLEELLRQHNEGQHTE